MKRLRLTIVGANSFLAKYLIKELRKDNFDLLLLARSLFPEAKETEFVAFDYPAKPLNFAELAAFDVILYLAGAGVQANSKESSELIYQLNSFIPIALLQYLSDNQFPGKVFTFGSYFELGKHAQQHPYTETALVRITTEVPSHYCGSKRLLTRFISNGLLKIKYYHLILPTIYGPGENSNRLIPYVIDCLINDRPLSLTSGEQSRSYLYAGDTVALIKELIESDTPEGIYNVSAAEQIQVKELVKLISSCLDKPLGPAVTETTRSDDSMLYLQLDATKLLTAVSWRPKSKLTDIIPLYYNN
jgi:nucleoside-diphosphate-sugar epimerase